MFVVSSLTPKILNGCDPAGKVGEDSVFPVALGLAAASFAASALILDGHGTHTAVLLG